MPHILSPEDGGNLTPFNPDRAFALTFASQLKIPRTVATRMRGRPYPRPELPHGKH